jgi:hypothetical protein
VVLLLIGLREQTDELGRHGGRNHLSAALHHFYRHDPITTVASPTVGGSVANSRQAPSALFASAPPSPGFPDPSRPRRERLLSPELGNSEANSENSNHLRCPYKTANYLHTATLYSRCCRFKSGGGLLSLLEEEALIPQAVLFEPL